MENMTNLQITVTLLAEYIAMITPFAIVALLILFAPVFRYRKTGRRTCYLAFLLKHRL